MTDRQIFSKGSTPNDWQLCILCQSHDAEKGTLVLHPRHDYYQCLIDSVWERVTVWDGEYVRIHQRLESCTPETLHVKEAMWHRSCYSEATNKCHIRARDRSCHELSTGTAAVKMRGQKKNKDWSRWAIYLQVSCAIYTISHGSFGQESLLFLSDG